MTPHRDLMLLITAIILFGISVEPLIASAQSQISNVCVLIKTLDPHTSCINNPMGGHTRVQNREALWFVISRICQPANIIGLNFPCLRYDVGHGFAIIRSPFNDALDFIITPTTKIVGIESPELLKTDTPNLWDAGWQQRVLLEEASKKKLSWNDVAMAVNSKFSRTQDQLHIHLGCVDTNIKQYFMQMPEHLKQGWFLIRLPHIRSEFIATILPADGLNENVFMKLAREKPARQLTTSEATIAVVGISYGNWQGFALLVSLNITSAESFLAKNC